MSIPQSLASLAGTWRGTNHLWVMPGEPVRESETTMAVAVGELGGFATLQYTWAEGGEVQQGLLALGPASDQNAIHAAWIDTWHMPVQFMQLDGALGADGSISLLGSYAAPTGPDWGWRIKITPGKGDTFQLSMYNVTPDGDEFLAVDVTYSRFHP